MAMALAPNCTHNSALGALRSIDSRENTLDAGPVLEAELIPMPTPMPNTKMPPKIAMDVAVNAGVKVFD
jgi:hypothetical protein